MNVNTTNNKSKEKIGGYETLKLQIELLKKRISKLTQHLKEKRKDFAAKKTIYLLSAKLKRFTKQLEIKLKKNNTKKK